MPYPGRLTHEHVVYITPAPILAWLERLDDWVLRLVKMFGCMLVLRRVAAAHVPALQAKTQVHPPVARFQALLATFPARLHFVNLIQMCAAIACHTLSCSSSGGLGFIRNSLRERLCSNRVRGSRLEPCRIDGRRERELFDNFEFCLRQRHV
jgi:hypothetical protein